jgi:O-antigen/teichoic acid export membrane protein
MIDSKFINGHQLCLFLSLGQVFSKMYFFNPGFSIEKRTDLFLKVALFSFVINVILNFILVPNFGVIGASISTCISAFSFWIIQHYYSNKLYTVSYNLKLTIVYLLVLILSFTLLNYLEYKYSIFVFVISVSTMLLFGKKSLLTAIKFKF